MSETDVLVGLFCFTFWGRLSVIGVSGEPVTYWRTRVFVKNYPCSNYCNIRLDAVYAFVASSHRTECYLACYVCNNGFKCVIYHSLPKMILYIYIYILQLEGGAVYYFEAIIHLFL